MTYDHPRRPQDLFELVEDLQDYDEELLNSYIEERRYEYRRDWFEFLEALDKE